MLHFNCLMYSLVQSTCAANFMQKAGTTIRIVERDYLVYCHVPIGNNVWSLACDIHTMDFPLCQLLSAICQSWGQFCSVIGFSC